MHTVSAFACWLDFVLMDEAGQRFFETCTVCGTRHTNGCGVAHVYSSAVVGPADVGGELATPAELRRLVATLQGFPTTEEQDRQQLQVSAVRYA
jgi:hypothetical protein